MNTKQCNLCKCSVTPTYVMKHLHEFADKVCEHEDLIQNIDVNINSKAPINNPNFTGVVSLPSSTSIGSVTSTDISKLEKLKLVKMNDYLHINHSNKVVNDILANNISTGFCIGNSIMQGTGTSIVSKTISVQVGSKLYAKTGNTSGLAWTPSNYGVGGSTTATAISYIANYRANSTKIITTNRRIASPVDYVIALTMRNDVSRFSSVSEFLKHLNILITLAKSSDVDFYYVIDNPKINITTGEVVDNDSNWGIFYQAAKDLCIKEGVTVIDTWGYLYDQKVNNNLDLRTIMSDGTHPNNTGYDIISEMVFQAITTSKISPEKKETNLKFEAVNVFDATSGTVTTTSTISGLTTASTSRKVELNTSTNDAFILTTGQTAGFLSPAPCVGVIIHFVSSSGSVNLTYNSVLLENNVSAFAGSVRESSVYVDLPTYFSQYKTVGTLLVTAVSNVSITGVTFITEKEIGYNEGLLDYTTNATLTSTTFTADSSPAQQMSTVNDYVQFEFYGSSISFFYERGVARGTFDVMIDDTTVSSVDAYLNASNFKQQKFQILLGEGWHTIRLTVTEKNVSSTANILKFGQFKFYSEYVLRKKYTTMSENQSYDFRQNIDNLKIKKTISGTPIDYKNKNTNTFTLKGGIGLIEY